VAKVKKVKSMTKSELFRYFSEKYQMHKQLVRSFFDDLADLAVKNSNVGFVIPGIGKLVLKDSKARMARNPRTGEKVHVPAKKRVKFRIAAACKRAILENVQASLKTNKKKKKG